LRCTFVLTEAPVHFLCGAFTGITIALLQESYQLVPFSLKAIEVRWDGL
jgi:hypothetical protein